MKSTSVPSFMSVAFGVNGQRQSLQSSSVTGTSLASYNNGFPPITMISKDAGGIPPQGKDFNQIFYELSADAQWGQASGIYPYNSEFSTSIGGYPKGALVLGSDGLSVYQSTAEDNTTVPGNDSSWTYLPKIDDVLSEFSSIDAQLKIAKCPTISDLRAVTGMSDGDRITVKSRVSGYAAMEFGMPWGGGDFVYCAELTGSQYADNGGSLIKSNDTTTYPGSWVRAELVDGRSNVIDSVWFLDLPPSFLNDLTDNIQNALDAAALMAVSDDLILNSNNAGPNGGLMVCKMPPRAKLTKSISCDISRVRIDGGRGIACFSPSGTYTQYTNSNLPSDIGSGKLYGLVFLKSTAYGSRDQWPVYRDMLLVQNWTISLQDLTTDYYEMSGTTTDNGITAFVHYGDSSDNQTAYTAQAQFLNVNVHYCGLGYVNGDYAWGVTFNNCKWVSNYWDQLFIPGSDNAERMEFIDNVWQNGVNGLYSNKFQAGISIKGGSFDWHSGVCFRLVDFNQVLNIELNHWELPSVTAQMIYATWSAVPYGNNYTNVTQVIISGVTMIIAPNTTSTATKAYIDIESGFCNLSMKNNSIFYSGISATPNFTLLNSATKHGFIAENNIIRGGIASQFVRDWRLKATWSNPYVLGSTYCTAGGDSGAPAAMGAVWNSNGTLTLTALSTFSGSYYMQLIIPMVNFNKAWNYIYPYCNLTSSSLATPANWTISWYYNIRNTTYPLARSTLSSLSLSSYGSISSSTELYPITGTGVPYIRNRYENLQSATNIPSPNEIYCIISVSGGFTSGDTITIGDCGTYTF